MAAPALIAIERGDAVALRALVKGHDVHALVDQEQLFDALVRRLPGAILNRPDFQRSYALRHHRRAPPCQLESLTALFEAGLDVRALTTMDAVPLLAVIFANDGPPMTALLAAGHDPDAPPCLEDGGVHWETLADLAAFDFWTLLLDVRGMRALPQPHGVGAFDHAPEDSLRRRRWQAEALWVEQPFALAALVAAGARYPAQICAQPGVEESAAMRYVDGVWRPAD